MPFAIVASTIERDAVRWVASGVQIGGSRFLLSGSSSLPVLMREMSNSIGLDGQENAPVGSPGYQRLEPLVLDAELVDQTVGR